MNTLQSSSPVTATHTRHVLVQQALDLLTCEMVTTDAVRSPHAVKDYLRLWLGDRPHEVFGVLFLNPQNRIIRALELFRGTLTQTAVYPREVVVESLALNAAAVIFCHNHPSGHTEPSNADRQLTLTLAAALALVDVKVLDHVVVSQSGSYSFAEHGLI
jgi:DNA repair protein RadC